MLSPGVREVALVNYYPGHMLDSPDVRGMP